MARVVAGRLRDMEDRFTDAMRDVPQGAAQGQDAQRRYDELADEVVQLYEKLDLSHHVTAGDGWGWLGMAEDGWGWLGKLGTAVALRTAGDCDATRCMRGGR
eukprot:3228606-Prymnesium_polylepis.1